MNDPQLLASCDLLIHHRQHVGPKHLQAPGPNAAELDTIFRAAAAAPDHGQLRPWRFIVIDEPARVRLADAFADALLERDPAALPQQLDEAREKAHRSPVLVLAVVDLRADAPQVHAYERVLSLGCAIQNMLLTIVAQGYSSGLTSGRAMQSQALRSAFKIKDGEHAVCCISIGTPRRSKPARARPQVHEFVSTASQQGSA